MYRSPCSYSRKSTEKVESGSETPISSPSCVLSSADDRPSSQTQSRLRLVRKFCNGRWNGEKSDAHFKFRLTLHKEETSVTYLHDKRW